MTVIFFWLLPKTGNSHQVGRIAPQCVHLARVAELPAGYSWEKREEVMQVTLGADFRTSWLERVRVFQLMIDGKAHAVATMEGDEITKMHRSKQITDKQFSLFIKTVHRMA